MWLADPNYEYNDVSKHPGHGFLAVIDADQQMIGQERSVYQVSDAAFSVYNQIGAKGDQHLDAISKFDDKKDYSSPNQPEYGVKVTPWSLTMNVVKQATNSSDAVVNLTRFLAKITAKFSVTKHNLLVKFRQESVSSAKIVSYGWSFGDSKTSTVAEPSHTYAKAGVYNLSLSVTDAKGNIDTTSQNVTVSQTPSLSIHITASVNYLTATFPAKISSGDGPYLYQWDFGDNTDISSGKND